MFHGTLKYFTQCVKENMIPPHHHHSCHFWSSCSIDGCYRHRSTLFSFWAELSWWFPGLWGTDDVIWSHQLDLQRSSVRLQHSFRLLFLLHSSFHIYALVRVVIFACLCTHLKINYSCNTNPWCFSLRMMALLFFFILMLELYFLIFFPHLPSVFLLQQFERIHLDKWWWLWVPIYNYAIN